MSAPPPSPAPRYRIRPAERRPSPAARLAAAVRARLGPTSATGRAARGLLLGVLAWFTLRHLLDGDFRGIYAGLNLVLHEAGHLVFQYGGFAWLTAAGGTLFHLMCIAGVGVAFWRQRDMFAVAVALWWSGTVFIEAAPYAADARAQELPLVTVGDGPVGHDWYAMLEPLGLLAFDEVIGAALRLLGLATLLLALSAGAWMLRCMHRAARTEPGNP